MKCICYFTAAFILCLWYWKTLLIMATLRCRCAHYIFVLWFLLLYSIFFFPWNVLHAARWKYRKQQIAKNSLSAHERTTFSGYVFTTKAHVDSRKKNLLNSSISPTCPYSMVKFGPLAAEISSLVWGTPANFNGFRVLAALVHGTVDVGVSQLCGVEQRAPPISAGRPSRWALAHILVEYWITLLAWGFEQNSVHSLTSG